MRYAKWLRLGFHTYEQSLLTQMYFCYIYTGRERPAIKLFARNLRPSMPNGTADYDFWFSPQFRVLTTTNVKLRTIEDSINPSKHPYIELGDFFYSIFSNGDIDYCPL